jgi:cytochrome o ubiquinol oxidase operon protein cyoD
MSTGDVISMSDSLSVKETSHTPKKNKLKTYVSGYVLSVALTLTAYLLATHQTASDYWFVIVMITILAFMQFLVQLVFFLHISNDKKQRWKLLVLIFMIVIVSILILGSLWIMNNLNYRMTPAQENTYMQDQDNL